jgi:hypothetical protein
MFEQFTQEVNTQARYNRDGIINTISIITYHNFTNTPNMDNTKYLYVNRSNNK